MIRYLLSTSAMLMVLNGTAHAESPAPADAADPAKGDVVVVGSRAAPRLRTDTPAPVDVLTGDALREQGFDSLSRVLEALSPSFNYTPAVTSPSAEGTRPATLLQQASTTSPHYARHSCSRSSSPPPTPK